MKGLIHGSNTMETKLMQEYFSKNPSANAYYRDFVLPDIKDGRVSNPSLHVDIICNLPMDGGMMIGEQREEDIFIDDWNVSSPELVHRHPEFGYLRVPGAQGIVEVDTTKGKCDLCHKVISGELDMIHTFYQI